MHLVAITRWGRPMQEELPELARRLGVVAYDLRMKLTGAPPVYFTAVDDATVALEHVAFLRDRGHGALVCAADEPVRADRMIAVRDFEFGDHAVRAVDATGRPVEMPYAEILTLIRAASITDEERTTTTAERKFSMGRAALTGGLMMQKTVEKVSHSTAQEREQVLYMFHRTSGAPWLWREFTLRYNGLGDDAGTSSIHNFVACVRTLVERAVHAHHDETLLTHKRRPDATLLSGTSAERRIQQSNDTQNDLAAHVIKRALIEGQL